MVATVVIEAGLALYTLWRYKWDSLTRLAVLTLVMLAAFQVSEYFDCTGSVGHVAGWSRLGFVFITTLPPLGIHLVHVLANKPKRRLVTFGYATMAAFIITFLAMPHVFTSYQCTGNYVIFHLRAHLGGLYWIYYFGWLITGIVLAARWANQFIGKGKEAQKRLQAVRGLIIGWLVFLVPTAGVNVIKPATRQGIPSIMCGFAVLFALILTFYIVPQLARDRRSS